MKTIIFSCTLLLVRAINLEAFNELDPMLTFIFLSTLMALDLIGFLLNLNKKG